MIFLLVNFNFNQFLLFRLSLDWISGWFGVEMAEYSQHAMFFKIGVQLPGYGIDMEMPPYRNPEPSALDR